MHGKGGLKQFKFEVSFPICKRNQSSKLIYFKKLKTKLPF